MHKWILMLFATAAALISTAPAAGAEPEKKPDPVEEFSKQIHPIFEKHCFECHNDKKHKGDLNLSSFDNLEKIKAAPDTFHTVMERVQAFEMPPEGKKELSFDDQHRLVEWLKELPQPAAAQNVNCDQIASDRNASYYRGYVMSRRINRAEYQNTMRDLFGMKISGLDALLPADGGGGEGFDTSGNALFISSIHIEKYLAAADQILNTVLADKPSTPEAKAARERILGSNPKPRKKAARFVGREVVARISRLAYRRPATDEEIDRSMTMFDRAWDRGDGYLASLRLSLKSVLISPDFLFLAEPEPSEKGVQPLGAFPLASKLSYFLWSSMPDEELLGLAESGKLLDPNIYREQVHRMLADPKAAALGERFAIQWLDLDRLGTEVKPDPDKFPEFDAELQRAMLQQVSVQFNYLVSGDHSLLDLIDSDYTFVNERLAKLYGIPGVSGPELRKVALADPNRGGIIGMAAIHALTSFPLRTSPVLRGKWVLEALIGQKINPPPPGTPAIEETTHKPENQKLSFRQQLEIHRNHPECSSCHDKMDPLGFGMENFDPLGRWRETDHGLPIDANGKLPSGETFTGPAGLKKILMARKEAVMRHLVRKMIGYAFGRELNRFDECVVNKTMEALKASGYRPSVMFEQITLSFPFRHRFYPKLEVNS